MAGSYKAVRATGSAEEALADAVEACESLAGECRDAAANFPSDAHPKAQAFEEAADRLEDAVSYLQDVDLEVDGAPDLPELSWFRQVPRRRAHHPSKASRLENARAAAVALEDTICAVESAAEGWAHSVASINGAVEAMDAVEFPGMFG